MKRKLMIVFISIVSTISIGYAYYMNILQAATLGTYSGNITMRVNKSPSGLTGSKTNIGFKKGDKIAIQAGNDNAWLLGSNISITNYDCPITLNQRSKPTRCVKPAIDSWLSLTTKSLADNGSV